jgi:hypothetical protein
MSITTSLKDVLLGAGITPTGQSATELLAQLSCVIELINDSLTALRAATFNNDGRIHTYNTNFNSLPATYAAHFVHSIGPDSPQIPSATQYYGFTLGLGSNFDTTNEACQIYWPRSTYGSGGLGFGGNPYISVRFKEGIGGSPSWSAWQRIYAGHADYATNAGNSATTSQTEFTELKAIGSIKSSGSYPGYIFSAWDASTLYEWYARDGKAILYKQGFSDIFSASESGVEINGVPLVVPTTWHSVTFQNAWSAYGGGQTVGYWKDNLGIVRIRGMLQANGETYSVAFNLPGGFRPTLYEYFPIVPTSGYCAITSDGNVIISVPAGTTWLSLSSVSFVAA